MTFNKKVKRVFPSIWISAFVVAVILTVTIGAAINVVVTERHHLETKTYGK